jgi:hypothetical protein
MATHVSATPPTPKHRERGSKLEIMKDGFSTDCGRFGSYNFVIPAKAGTQCGISLRTLWVPAFAGMTNIGCGRSPPQNRHQKPLSYIIELCQPSSRLFESVDKDGRDPKLGCSQGAACRARREVQIGARIRLNFTEL